MTKVVYFECDRCGKRINEFKDVHAMVLIGKSREFCKECAEEFLIWIKKKEWNEKQ